MSDSPLSPRRRSVLLGLGALFLLLLTAIGPTASPASAAATPMVSLGQASSYAGLSGASVANTVSGVGAPHTILRGDLGVKPSAQPTGFPPGEVTGTVNVGNGAAAQAHADLVTAYTEVAARPAGATLAPALAGATVGPGLHRIPGAASNTTTLTLDAGGDPNAVFVFQVDGALAFAAGSHVVLAGGARASRVFWQVNGAASVGANADFAGTLMAYAAIDIGNATKVNGRLLARTGALSLDANDVYSAPPVVAIAGGATATTTDTTPTISGTTDVAAPGLVTVTVGSQTLTATPSAGAWSVTSAILANGSYPVVASVMDGAGNPGSASQTLTVDTVPPAVTLDGGPSRLTADPSPTISGTSDVAAGTTVQVEVGGQTLPALVQPTGTWNVAPAPLGDGAYAVTATVIDPAGNPAAAQQTITVDTTAPGATIDGGVDRLTNDATPTISGTADVPGGSLVRVDLADETRIAAVQDSGAWAVDASALADGPHRITMAVSDPAGNRTTTTQTLTVDTVAPVLAIAGGATARTSDTTPTVVGTCDAQPGTTVVVSIAGQTLRALVQADHSWNATPRSVGRGTHPVVASVTDPAGNRTVARQSLTIGDGDATTPGDPGGPGTTPGAVNPAAATVVAPNARQQVKGRALTIATKVTAPAGGRITARATGTVKIAGVKKRIALKTVTKKIAARRSATLTLRPTGSRRAAAAAFARIAAAVKAGRKVTATITIRITDAHHHTRTVKRTVKLTR